MPELSHVGRDRDEIIGPRCAPNSVFTLTHTILCMHCIVCMSFLKSLMKKIKVLAESSAHIF